MRRKSDHLMLGFHWVTSLLVAATFAIGLLHAHTELLDDSPALLDVHRSLGLAILAVTLARLLARMRFGPIQNGSDLTLPIRIASRATHVLIYACLVIMPLLGWAQSSAATRHFKLFGTAFPALVRRDLDLSDTLAWWHTQVGWLFLSLIALHAMAALFHHYVLRDDVLVTMIPARSAPVREEPRSEWTPGIPEPKRRAA
jgi:cytochrome b561